MQTRHDRPAEQLPQARLATVVALVVMYWPGVQLVRAWQARFEVAVGATAREKG